MKTLTTIILAVLFPLLALSQEYNHNLAKLKTMDERTVDLGEIFQDNDLTIVYFFNECCKNLTDQFDYLESLAESHSDINLKVIAVYNASNSNYARVKPFVSGNDISIETFIDVNGELQRAMGLPVNSTIILTRYTDTVTGQYEQSVSYTAEQAGFELSDLISANQERSAHEVYFSINQTSE